MTEYYDVLLRNLNLKCKTFCVGENTSDFKITTTFENLLNSNLKEIIEKKTNLDLTLLYQFIKDINKKKKDVKLVIRGFPYIQKLQLKSLAYVDICEYEDTILDLQNCNRDYFYITTAKKDLAKTLTNITNKTYNESDITNTIYKTIRDNIHLFANTLIYSIIELLEKIDKKDIENYIEELI